MTTEIRDLHPSDLSYLLTFDMNEKDRSWCHGQQVEIMCRLGKAFYYKETLLMAGGIIPYWNGRGQVWTIFSPAAKSYFVSLFRAIKRYLVESGFNRIEASCCPEDKRARRRLDMLGFKLDCERAVRFLPDGTDQSLYSWVRN